MRWRRDQEAGPDRALESGEPGRRGLVYLIVTGEAVTDDRAAWNRSRSVLLEVDSKIAATRGIAYQVRALQGDEDALRGELREAGQLTRRDVKRPVAHADFARVLEEIREMLERDRAFAEPTAAAAARPAVVFFAPDPPLADTVTAEVFQELAEQASIIWVVPKRSVDLIAPPFKQPSGVRVVEERETVAAEIAALLNVRTNAAPVGEATAVQAAGHEGAHRVPANADRGPRSATPGRGRGDVMGAEKVRPEL
jgi:hypothetical protein